jgi:hypothetical protein
MVVATVTRTLLARVRVGQLLAPIGIGVGVIARRTMNVPLIIVTAVVYLAALGAFLSARRTLRRVEVRGAGHALTFVSNGGVAVHTGKVYAWTFDRGRARVYDGEGGWSVRGNDAEALKMALTHALGSPLRLERRGSRRARLTALAVAVAGAPAMVAGAAFEIILLFMAGLLASLFGLATFAALSRKVRPESRG